MKKLMLAFLTILASGSAVAQAPAPVPPHRLTGAEIRALGEHTSYSAGRFGPKTSTAYFTPDGQVRVRSPDVSDTGTYRITDDDMYCSNRKLRDGVETCQTIWQTGPNTYETHLPNGTVIKGTIVPGNPEGL
jgi:hypothetical protein